MSESNITKLALANSLKKLMSEKPFSKISVRDIAEDCGLTRQAYYYHFKDKYDLMNWIYYTETAWFMVAYDSFEHWTDGLKELCCYMKKNHFFYVNALNTTGQNSFQEYLHDYITKLATAAIEKEAGIEFDEKKWTFIVEFIATAFVALLVRWANQGMIKDPEEYVDDIRLVFDGSILYELKYGKNTKG